MAKAKAEKTPAVRAWEAAKTAYKTAKAAHDKQSNEKNKATMDAAKARVAELATPVNRERFIKIAGGRGEKACTAIEQLQACTNKRAYQYTEADAAQITDAIGDALNGLAEKFKAALASPNTARGTAKEKGSRFTFANPS